LVGVLPVVGAAWPVFMFVEGR